MFRKTLIILAMLFAILGSGAKAWGEKITTLAGITSGNKYYIGATTSSTDYYFYVDGSATAESIKGVAKTNKTEAVVLTFTAVEGGWTIKFDGGNYLGIKNEKDNGAVQVMEAPVVWTIEEDANKSLLKLHPNNTYYLQKNNSGTQFGSYANTQTDVWLEAAGSTPSAELESIAISGNPTKTTYEAGEEFDPAGLTVTGTYSDASTAPITSGITWDVNPAGALEVGTTSVSVTATVGEITSEAYVVNGLTVTEFVQTYANTYTSDASLSSVITGSKVKWEGCKVPDGYAAYKFNKGTFINITVPASTKTVHLHMVAWKGESADVAVKLGETSLSSIKPTADDGVANNSPFTLTTEPKTENSYYFPIEVNTDEEATLSLTTASNKRAILFGVNFEAAPTKTLESIAVNTPPTKIEYNVGDNFAPAGLVITATYDDESTEDIAYSGNESKFTFEPNLETALTTANDKVTITYGGESCNQAITVNLNKLATPTNLQATNVTSTSATLTWDAVTGASSYEVTLNSEVKTAETNSLLVEGLNAETTYTWTVKAIGDNTTYADSETSESSNFTTPALPTVTYTVTFNGNNHGTPAEASITEAGPAAGVTLPDVTPNAGYQFVGWATTNTATEADAGEVGNTYYPTANITLYAVYNRVYTINYMVNGVNTNPQENVLAGTALVFPEVTAPDADHVFRGWVTEAIEGTTDTEPDYVNITGLTATQNITYYAVFAEESEGEKTLTKLTSISDLSTGDNIAIVAKISDDNIKLMYQETVSSSYVAYKTVGTDVALTADGISADSKNYWTLTAGSDENWKLGDATIGYLNGSSSSNNLYVKTETPITEFSITYASNHFAIKCGSKSVGSRSDLTGDNQYKFRMGGTTTLDFYKLSNGAPTYSNFCTTIVTKVLTSISLSGEYPTEFWKGEAFSHEGMTVTAHYSNAPDADVTNKATFTGYDMATAGEQIVTVTYDTQSTTYGITVKTIANTQKTAYTTAEAIDLIDANPAELATTEVYVKGTVSKVESYNSTYHSITYWLDENAFEVYSGKNLNGADFSSMDDIQVGDDVVVYGLITKWNSTYEFAQNNYLVSHVKVATLEIGNVTVEIEGDIVPAITTNVVGDYTISYTSDNEEVVFADGDEMITMGLGEATITATLTAEGYKDATTTFTVEVIKALQSIAVKTAPTTTSYKEGDKFNPAGLVIALTYSEGEPEDIAYEENEDKFTFEPSLETPLTTENKSVTITYAGKEATQEISVRALYTYNITWMANGEQFTITQVTEDNTLALPETNPDNIGDMVFQGWIDTENYYHAETAPEYIVPSEIIPTEAMTFYAVYAKAEEGEPEETEFSFNTDNFTEITTSYTTIFTHTFPEATVEAYGVYKNDGIQMNSGKGTYIKNTTAMPGYMSKIVLTWKESGKNSVTMYANANSVASTSSDNLGKQSTTTTTHTINIDDAETKDYKYFYLDGTTVTGACVLTNFSIFYMKATIVYSNFCTTVKPIEEDKTISENTVWEGNITINEHTVTIGSGAVLTVNGALINSDPENLVIKDGAQLIFNNAGSSKDNDINSGVKATVEKNIIPYGRDVKGWHFLAAPMRDFAVASFINQANGNYDLYRWYIREDGTPIWYNYKAHDSNYDNGFETNFVSGRGYLAAYQTTDLLRMQGTLNAGTEFDFTEELNSKGNFTLLGNPFTYDLNWSEFTMNNVYNGFAVVNSGDGTIDYFGSTSIKVGTGFMVYTEGDDATLSFTKGSGSGKSNDILALNLFAGNGNGEDNTIIVLDDKNGGFAKASNFNTNVPQIYTEKNQTKYGIRNFSTDTKEFNVSFKAAGEGSNTIRLETIGEFDYVHLYDKLLDVDVDMLLEGSYTFEASEGDDTHRFIVRIDKGNTGIDENETENFVSVYNGEIHVSGIGEVQIFDVMGRMVHSEVLSGDATISTSNIKDGIYVVKLIGDGWTKAEKIVVRR